MAAVMLLPQRSVPGRLFEHYLDLDRRFFHPASSPWQAVPLPDLPLLRGSMVEHLVQLGSLRWMSWSTWPWRNPRRTCSRWPDSGCGLCAGAARGCSPGHTPAGRNYSRTSS
jgi:hypothetical protein